MFYVLYYVLFYVCYMHIARLYSITTKYIISSQFKKVTEAKKKREREKREERFFLCVSNMVCVSSPMFLKRSIFPLWSRQQKDDIETEMWKHSDSELDLHSQHEGEEEADRKSSSDVTLCVNPEVKINS